MRKNITSCFLASLFLFTACIDGFEEMNTNPNNPDKMEQVDLLLTKAIYSSCRQQWSFVEGRGTILANYSYDDFTSMFGDAFAPSATATYFFSDLRNIEDIIRKTDVEPSSQKNLLGIALVYKSYLYQTMTDVWGDFPYSEAFKGKEGVNYPNYDSQSDIYKGILSDLERANTLLSASGENAYTSDALFGGDVTRWRKFANSLRIRVLMRLSSKSGENVNAQLQQIVSNPQTYPIFTGNDDQAAFTFGIEEGYQSNTYLYRATDFDPGFSTSEVFCNTLKAWNDPRLMIHVSPTKSTIGSATPVYTGVPNCMAESDAVKYIGGDKNNYFSRRGPLFISRQYSATMAHPTAMQTILMSYSELQLYLAEARERGLITAGDAATYYRTGIEANFKYWKSRLEMLDQTAIAAAGFTPASELTMGEDYFAQSAVKYEGTQSEKLAKIYRQKWVALFMTGLEGWFEWRRTGCPQETSVTPPADYRSISSVAEWPRRATYPDFENTYNTESYRKAVQTLGKDDLVSRTWIDRP